MPLLARASHDGWPVPLTQPLQVEPAQAPLGVRMLVIDDDPRICRSIASSMARTGFQVFSAEDGLPALAIAEQTPPDLVIVDFNMPTPGLEVVRKLKALHGQAVWIVVLSGQDDEDTRLECFDAGADDVLAKPVAMAELKRRMLAAARTQQAFVEARLGAEQTDRLMAYGAEASAMLAHDLNNGLAVALGNMTYLQEVVKLDDEEGKALAATVRALKRMSGLVANFVDIARFEDAAVKPKVEPTNLRAMIHEVVDVHAVGTSTAQFILDCDPGLVGNLDCALIERVLHNLIGNAIRYCNKRGTIRVTARVSDLVDSGIELSVYNSGPHVPESIRDKLFAKYAKGTNGKRGFGLYFCRLACEAHGGSISYDARPDGSAFLIRLPGHS
jgi:two-component system sensor histidine kinase/response regulator